MKSKCFEGIDRQTMRVNIIQFKINMFLVKAYDSKVFSTC